MDAAGQRGARARAQRGDPWVGARHRGAWAEAPGDSRAPRASAGLGTGLGRRRAPGRWDRGGTDRARARERAREREKTGSGIPGGGWGATALGGASPRPSPAPEQWARDRPKESDLPGAGVGVGLMKTWGALWGREGGRAGLGGLCICSLGLDSGWGVLSLGAPPDPPGPEEFQAPNVGWLVPTALGGK